MATDPAKFTLDAMLADSAEAVEGKLYVLGGGWNMVTTNQFPFQQPRIALALLVGVPYTATNKPHTLEFVLQSEDGQGVMQDGTFVPLDGDSPPKGLIGGRAEFAVGRPALIQSGDRQNLPLAINIDRATFRVPGLYSFVLSIDGEEINRLSFRVNGPPGINLGARG